MRSGQFILKYRWMIIILSLLISGAFGFQIFRAEIDPDLEAFLPSSMASRINTQKIEELFGGDELMIVLLEADDVLNEETLKRLKGIRRELRKADEFDKILSLFDVKNIRSEYGALLVEPAIRRIPKTPESREKVREQLMENEMAYELVVSEDFTLTALIVSVTPGYNDEEQVNRLKEILSEVPGEEEVYFGGLPFIKAKVSEELAREFKLLMIIGLCIMLVMLYLFFREFRGVLLPFLVVILAVLFAMGLMPLFGWKMTIINLLLPIILIAIANDYGIHLMARYQELNTEDNNQSIGSISKNVFRSLRKPILYTGITTVAGILCLLSHRMIPARQLGILASAGISFALVLSLLLIPAILSLLGKSRPVLKKQGYSDHILERILKSTGNSVVRHPGRIVMLAILISIVSGIGIIWLRVDTNLESFFPRKHEVRISAGLINDIFGGSQNISILVEGDIKDPDLLKRIDHYQEELETHPSVGNVTSIAMVIREISKAMNEPDDSLYDEIPSSRNAIAQYLELYSMSGDPDDLEKLVDFDYMNAQILVRINNGSNASLNSVLTMIEEITSNDENITRIGGSGLVAADLGKLVVRGQIVSLVVALIIIIIVISLIFRSLEAGLISAVPLGLAMILLFGWMGYLGIRLDVATALLSSIMIGVGVDYTIHFLWRYRVEKQGGLKSAVAIRKTLLTTGRGITFNALSVILGFSALPFSVFPTLRFFGFLVMVSIAACLLGALVIIPALVLIFRPAFLEPGKVDKKEYLNIRVRYISKIFRIGLVKVRNQLTL